MDIEVEEREIKNLLEKLNVRKAPGPSGPSNWIWRECNEQLTYKMQILFRVIKKKIKLVYWKCTNIVVIQK